MVSELGSFAILARHAPAWVPTTAHPPTLPSTGQIPVHQDVNEHVESAREHCPVSRRIEFLVGNAWVADATANHQSIEP